MGEVLNRLLQAIRLDREAFVWMDFNDRATGDGLILVAITRILILLGSGWTILGLSTSLTGIQILIAASLTALVFWLAYSGLVFAITKFLLGGSGDFAVFLRISGFAYPTLLLTVFTARLGLAATAAFVLGSIWFLAVVTRGVMYEGDLPTEKAVLAAGGGLVGWIIISAIWSRGII